MVRRGQVLVVVLFVLAIGITVAMAISSRSVTEIAVSTTQDESSRALEAAQIGLERYLGGLQTADGSGGELVDMNASFVVPTAYTAGGQRSYQLPYSVKSGEVATIVLASNLNSGVKLCWCQEDDATCPGTLYPKIEVAFYYRDLLAGTQNVKRRAIRPAAESPTDYLSFIPGTGRDKCSTDTWFRYSATINFSDDVNLNVFIPAGSNKDFVRIRLLDACDNGGECYGVRIAAFAITNQPFPSQWAAVESIGTSGDTVQKIKATVMVYDLPAVFDTAVFAGNAINKN